MDAVGAHGVTDRLRKRVRNVARMLPFTTSCQNELTLTGRIEAIGGSFFDQIPSGADIYMLVRVLHDWSDEDCLRILRACRTEWDLAHLRADSGAGSAAGPTDRLLGGHPDDGHVRSARERTEHEFGSLLSESGFTLQRVIPTQSSVWIVEAAPSIE